MCRTVQLTSHLVNTPTSQQQPATPQHLCVICPTLLCKMCAAGMPPVSYNYVKRVVTCNEHLMQGQVNLSTPADPVIPHDLIDSSPSFKCQFYLALSSRTIFHWVASDWLCTLLLKGPIFLLIEKHWLSWLSATANPLSSQYIVKRNHNWNDFSICLVWSHSIYIVSKTNWPFLLCYEFIANVSFTLVWYYEWHE